MKIQKVKKVVGLEESSKGGLLGERLW